MQISVSIEFKSTVTFSRLLSKDSLLVSGLQYLLDPRAEQDHSAQSRAAAHTEQEVVSIPECLGSQTEQTKDKKEVLCFQHVTLSRSEGQKDSSGSTSLHAEPYLPQQILSSSYQMKPSIYTCNKGNMWI